MSQTAAASSPVAVRVFIPEDVLDAYEVQAQMTGRTVDQLITERLTTFQDHTDAKPLYFTDEDRQELEQILGKNVLNVKDAIRQVRTAMSVKVQKINITLQQNLLMKLKSRCLGMKWEDFLTQRIVHALEQYVGMR